MSTFSNGIIDFSYEKPLKKITTCFKLRQLQYCMRSISSFIFVKISAPSRPPKEKLRKNVSLMCESFKLISYNIAKWLIILAQAFKMALIRGQVTSNVQFLRKRNIRRYIQWDDCSCRCLFCFVSLRNSEQERNHSSKRGVHVYFWDQYEHSFVQLDTRLSP